MASPKRLVPFVEGPGDSLAVSALVKKLLTEQNAWEHVFLDTHPFIVRNVAHLTRNQCADWISLAA